MEFIGAHYSAEFKAVMALLLRPAVTFDELLPALASRALQEMDHLHMYASSVFFCLASLCAIC
jgi:hypothetical protein